MAKGDKSRVRNTVNEQVGQAQNLQNNLRDTLVPQNQVFQNQYQQASGEAMNDYRDIMNQYRQFQATTPDRINAERLAYSRTPEVESALRGYQGFADTGGFSPQAIQDMRARGVSPIRAAYANSQNELTRQRALQGGYSPNYTAALSKMTGQRAGMMSDAMQDINANLAQMQQQGRLAGLSGLSGTALSDSQMANQMAMANAENQLRAGMFNSQNIDPMRLNAIQGQAQLFGTQPGMAGMFGNQLLNSGNQLLNQQGQQQNLANMAITGQLNAAQIPSNFEVGLGRAGQIGGMVSNVAAPWMGVMGGGGGMIPSGRIPGAN